MGDYAFSWHTLETVNWNEVDYAIRYGAYIGGAGETELVYHTKEDLLDSISEEIEFLENLKKQIEEGKFD